MTVAIVKEKGSTPVVLQMLTLKVNAYEEIADWKSKVNTHNKKTITGKISTNIIESHV